MNESKLPALRESLFNRQTQNKACRKRRLNSVVATGLQPSYVKSFYATSTRSRESRVVGEIPKNLCKFGVWNVRGLNEGWKGSSVIQVMRERKYDVLALSETKLKGNGMIE